MIFGFYSYTHTQYKLRERKRKTKSSRVTPHEREKLLNHPNRSTRPATVTRSDLSFPATIPAKTGTDRKLLSCWSSTCHSCRQKPSEKPLIEHAKAVESPPQLAMISTVSGDATTWLLFLTLPSVFSDYPMPPRTSFCR